MAYLKNSKGEDLYTLCITQTNEGAPAVFIRSWEACVKFINDYHDQDDSNYKIKIIEKHIDAEHHRAHLYMLCNHKGWGSDYYKSIYVEPAYSFD